MTDVPAIDAAPDGGLALALVAASNMPLLLLDDAQKVISASASFCRAFDINPAEVSGRQLDKLGGGEWAVPQLRSLLNATGSGAIQIDGYEMDLKREGRPPRRLIVNARALEYPGEHDPRLVLAISDVTDQRLSEKAKDDLLREKGILLQEIQHRVANSLQIIASVLMQSARRVQSEETRSYLNDAHNRVMSVASVQQHLATSRLGDVQLKPYFTQLCESIAASMIRDPGKLSLNVSCDDTSIPADLSVSLGLIVTELVINALKHAFPGRRKGHIDLSYKAAGDGWTLSVSDNGVGLPTGTFAGTPGLGTSIVEALAKQAGASVETDSSKAGTKVSIVRE